MTHTIDHDEPLIVVKKRSPWVAISFILTFVFVIYVLYGMATNKNFEWNVVATYFLSGQILEGLKLTLFLTLISMAIGVVGGLVLAMMKISRIGLLRYVSGAYVWLFRSVPLLVQLLFWFNIAALIPVFELGIPFGPTLYSVDANTVISALAAAIIGLSLHEAAYSCEIIRSGIVSVERSQRDAGKSLGMNQSQIYRYILLPQAMRSILPPMMNRLIGMVKDTSLVSVLALSDILYTAQGIYSRTFQIIPLLVVVCIWYMIIVAILNYIQGILERFYGKGFV